MNIEDFVKAKRQMEEEIRDATKLAVDKFRAETGFAPNCIGIRMLDVHIIGRTRKDWIVGDVRAEVGIE